MFNTFKMNFQVNVPAPNSVHMCSVALKRVITSSDERLRTRVISENMDV